MCRAAVVVVQITLGQHVFFFRLQHWKLPDFLHVTVKPALGCGCRQSCVVRHCKPLVVKVSGSVRVDIDMGVQLRRRKGILAKLLPTHE